MSVPIKVSPHARLELCRDCDSEHLNPPCGMTYAQRLRSITSSTDWMPCKTDSRQRGMSRSFYDDEPLKEQLGFDRKERREILMDETKGYGPLTKDSPPDPKHFEAVMGFDPTKDDDGVLGYEPAPGPS